MDRWNREILDKYCSTFKVGIVAFVQPASDDDTLLYDRTKNKKLPISVGVKKR